MGDFDFGDGKKGFVDSEVARKVDPNCPVFQGIVANPLTPAYIKPAQFQFTQATVRTPARITNFTATFDQGPARTFQN